MSFSKLGLSPALIASLPAEFNTPTEIQTLAIPAILNGGDLLAIAQTGSGKTLAYGLPLLAQIETQVKSTNSTQALILVPTRELATQVTDALSDISQRIFIAITCLCGGVDPAQQRAALSRQPEIIVATPGRLLAFLTEGAIDSDLINQLVLDEADKLLEMGFWPDVQKIAARLADQRETLLFSATFSAELKEQAAAILTDPRTIQASAATNSDVSDRIEETLYLVNKGSKANALIEQIKLHQWPQLLVFIGARDNADALCKKLNKAGISAAALHGNKNQAERSVTLEQFKQQEINVLIGTDLLARGIDVVSLPAVINFELPTSPEVYVHRIGRTARAGKQGIAISLVCHAESDYLNAIRQLTQRALPLNSLAGFPVTDKPPSGESKRAPRDKQANRRSQKKKSIKQFQGSPKRS